MEKLIFIELNEINFDYVEKYISLGYLPNFKKIFDKYGYIKTTSEKKYEELEPWIQWVSIRTGKTYSEHKVFRLGDIEKSQLVQHWELIESKGYKVAAISPINGSNRTKYSDFFIPDPWVRTKTSGSKFIHKLSRAISQAVNDNASNRLALSSIFVLFIALLKYFKFSSVRTYIINIIGILKGYHWSRTILFERLLSDTFFNQWKKYKPDFTTVFFNSGAHIQHHYMYNSLVYDGESINPTWYIPKDKDPLLEVLSCYDEIINDIINLNTRVMIATGLTQIPFPNNTFYYRLKNHEDFFISLNCNFIKIIPRMSRDFLVECSNPKEAVNLFTFLSKIIGIDGSPIFKCDPKGKEIFVELIYPKEISSNFSLYYKDKIICKDFSKFVAFVAIKNGHHSGTGYFLDTGNSSEDISKIKIENIFHKVLNNYN